MRCIRKHPVNRWPEIETSLASSLYAKSPLHEVELGGSLRVAIFAAMALRAKPHNELLLREQTLPHQPEVALGLGHILEDLRLERVR